MPGALIAALSAPIRELQALVGTGGDDTAVVLSTVRDALGDVAASVRVSWRHAQGSWFGAGADAAQAFLASTASAIDELADHVDRLSTATRTAADAVAQAHARLQAIVDDFEARAAALEPYLDSPGVAEKLLAEARRSLREAVAAVEDLEAELDGQVTTMGAPAPPAPSSPPAATAPAGLGAPSGLSPPAMPTAPTSGLGGALGELASLARPESAAPVPDAATFGDGVAVRLPDGSTALAPNAVAGSAVRYALTQLGVPYEWGGTTPGVGLDCSGLTQWAYREAGLNIPRLAQEQDVGAAVDAGSLRPGDLAVWDGHVAMIVGNGTMIEAGDPVKLSPIRTENAGQGFQGFWRPTA
ncbi:C40 family peptidase [Mycolicibacterium pulveris]|uniref:Glycoside hydrolase n=1 Tax=Mycolicibacterium pulveris TaxID=36813 RepID=A0A7I7UE84_MYCPV|nr:NlpC/P60 family protein [Mycolicibacterium pulveris]MCV6979003.1 C40 family peptidase [Mycolicibacterium pulveris]BBY79794.1 glycoside hydrolase [Mycolicibacterium pulveris]